MNKALFIPILLGLILLSGCSSDNIYIFAGANNISVGAAVTITPFAAAS
jgi:hypothetical protein